MFDEVGQYVWTRKSIPNKRFYPGSWAKFKILHVYLSRLLNQLLRLKSLLLPLRSKKVAARIINIKTHHLFSKQRILSVHVTNAQRKTSGDLTPSCSWITCRIIIKLILICLSNSVFNSFMKTKNKKWTVFRFPFFMKT